MLKLCTFGKRRALCPAQESLRKRWLQKCKEAKARRQLISFLKIILEVNPSHKDAKLKLKTLISSNP